MSIEDILKTLPSSNIKKYIKMRKDHLLGKQH